MSNITTNIGFSPTTPAAPAGYQNAVPQSDGGNPFQTISEYVPNTGGVATKTANYTAVAGDCGLLLSFNSSSAVTLTLPAAAPFSQWNISVQNIGTGTLTVDRNGLDIDGAAANLMLATGAGVVLATDGTNYFTERGAATGGGGGGSVFYGDSEATATAGQDQITIGSTPIGGSVVVTLNGVKLPAAVLTISGAVATTLNGWAAGDVIGCTWATANSTPGSITLATATLANPAIRGTGLQASSSSSYAVSWPAGTVAGDFAVICGGHGFTFNTPAGWTLVDNPTGSNWNGLVISKVLNAADILAGSVTVTAGGGFDGTVGIVTFVGPTNGIREIVSQRSGAAPTPITLTTSGGVLLTDTAIYFGSIRSASTNTFNRGTLQHQANDGSAASSCLYTELLSSSGVLTAIVSYSVPGGSGGEYEAIVIVEAIPSSATPTPQLTPSQTIGTAITSITTTGSGAATKVGSVLNIPTPAGAGGVSAPSIRGTNIQASSASSFTVSWPSGTLAGDLVLIFGGGGWNLNNPSGWTVLDNSSGSNWNGAAFARILTTADISAGSVSISFAGSFDAVLAIISIVGQGGGVRSTTSSRNGGGSSTITLSTADGSPLTTDLAIYFGSNRGASTDTVSLGANLQQVNDGSSASGCLYAGSPAALGGLSPVFSYSSAGSGNYQVIVVLKGS